MRTSQSIETSEERKRQTGEKKPDGRGHSPGSHTPVGKRYAGVPFEHLKPYQWKPGETGNSSGCRPKRDVAREIAKAVFEKNQKKLYNAFARAALKGNAYAFQQLADRAYGKLKERVEYEVTQYAEVSEKAIIERIAELENQLGIVRQIESVGGTENPPERTLAASSEKKD